MELREVIDKSKWGDGPWQTEPDRKEWQHAGFQCLIVRVESHGGLCGYIGVPPGHPWHGKPYHEVEADCHGGLTYASECRGAVCHVPAPGEPENLWWLGFDHAHAWDFSPARSARYSLSRSADEVYRDMEYATKGVESLAEQAAQAAIPTEGK